MNRELLARVRDRIAEVGNEHCAMSPWAEGTVKGDGEPNCGTTACIAGWTLAVIKGEWRMSDSYSDLTRDIKGATWLLDLPSEVELFHRDLWPGHYQDLAKSEGDAKGMLSLLDAILDGRVIFNDDGRLVDLEEQLADEVEEMAQ